MAASVRISEMDQRQLAATKDYADAVLIIGSGHPADLPPIMGNLSTQMLLQQARGPTQRLTVIDANDIPR